MAQKSTTEAETKPEAAPVTPETAPEVTPAARLEMANKLVDRFAVWGGVAGLIPVPVIDVATVAGIQLNMLRKLSLMYNVPFSENSGKALIAALAGTMIPATSGIGAASMLKSVPIVGTIASGFVMPALAAGATYAIGKAFVQHFESGGTLLDFNPPDYREFIKAQKERWDARQRAKVAAPESAKTDGTSTGATTNP
ncbi:YcjF family protein [Pseudorhodoplanes sp.]|uniref:YcjF family protein n=1 Tax=Pseudorhodoplanes sp. TaxID=1934341 RepID=UPI00391AAFB6